MKSLQRKFVLIIVLLLVLIPLAGCEQNRAEIEEMKIEQTVSTFMTGYEKNDAAQILSVVALDEEKKADFAGILSQFLQSVHREPYIVKIAYQIDNILINEDIAEIKLTAILRMYENDSELLSIRLFQGQNLYLIKSATGEWRINFKQFIPAELLKVDALF